MTTTLYVAGPMTGIEDFNYLAFREATRQLRVFGFAVQCPTEHPGEDATGSRDWSWYMRAGITKLMRCDAVAVLPGWEGSRGARIEVQLAGNLGMPVRTVQGWLTGNAGPVACPDPDVEAAVDAAARVLHGPAKGSWPSFDEQPAVWRDADRRTVRPLVEAAAPLLRCGRCKPP